MHMNRRAIGAFAAAAVLLVGGGSALAASPQDRAARCDERLAKIAEHHGVSVEQLEAQLKARLTARVDAAEKAGKINAQHAARLRERIADVSLCGDRARVHAAIAGRGMLVAAARFLRLDGAALRAQLPGNSLAGLAAKQGKDPAALERAMTAPGKKRLARAVANGRLSAEQAAKASAVLEAAAHRLATRVFPGR